MPSLSAARDRSARGNVLFLILIAVALFAALAYAVTQSSRSSGDGVSKDKNKLTAAQIIQYATSVEQSVTRLLVINKVPDYMIDMSATNISGSAANTTCVDETCQLFHSNGGALPGQTLPDEAWDLNNVSMTGTWRGKIYFYVVGIVDVGSTLPELVMTYPGVTKEVCAEINTKLGIANLADGTPPTDTMGTVGTNAKLYSGALTTFPTVTGVTVADTATAMRGQRTFCVAESSGVYYFYHTLIAR